MGSLSTSGPFWMASMMGVGAILVIVMKLQNSAYVYEGPIYKNNFHPYMQTAFMFLGEMMSLPTALFLRSKNPQAYKEKQLEGIAKGKKTKINKILFLVPACLDLLTSTMQFVAFNFIPPSSYQILKGGSIATTFIVSALFLKQKILRRQLIGSIFVLFGLLIIGAGNFIFGSSSSQKGTFVFICLYRTFIQLELIGYFLMIISLFTMAFMFVYEQKILSNYIVEPLQVVGYEGSFGFAIYLIIIPILCFVPCPFGIDACIVSEDGQLFIQGAAQFFRQLHDNPHLIVLTILIMFGVAFFNVAGVAVTKYVNAVARSIGNMTKGVPVWILGIIVTVTMGINYPNYRWESLDWKIIVLQGFGFGVIILGNLVYIGVVRNQKLVNSDQYQSMISQKEKQQILDSQVL